jgi:hypothetical protein
MAIMVLIFTGCSNKDVIEHDYTYKGESELWTAEYKVNGTGTFTKKDGTLEYDSDVDTILTVTYKKALSELSSVKNLEISYETSAGGGKLNENFDDIPPNKKTYTLKSGRSGGAIENKDEIIKVNISIDGKSQTLELKNVPKILKSK